MALSLSFGAVTAEGDERRALGRIPMEQELRVRTTSGRKDQISSGQTINMTSKGLLFKSDRALPAGKRVEIAISWPARLNDRCALKLVARGKIVRTSDGITAVAIQQHEFRTMGSGNLGF